MAEHSDHLLAARLASEAGVLLVATRQELSEAGADGRTLKDEGDGMLVLTAISDDNFNAIQRTVLLQFVVEPAR